MVDIKEILAPYKVGPEPEASQKAQTDTVNSVAANVERILPQIMPELHSIEEPLSIDDWELLSGLLEGDVDHLKWVKFRRTGELDKGEIIDVWRSQQEVDGDPTVTLISVGTGLETTQRDFRVVRVARKNQEQWYARDKSTGYAYDNNDSLKLPLEQVQQWFADQSFETEEQ